MDKEEDEFIRVCQEEKDLQHEFALGSYHAERHLAEAEREDAGVHRADERELLLLDQPLLQEEVHQGAHRGQGELVRRPHLPPQARLRRRHRRGGRTGRRRGRGQEGEVQAADEDRRGGDRAQRLRSGV